jgi:hypothetical protein
MNGALFGRSLRRSVAFTGNTGHTQKENKVICPLNLVILPV